MNRKVVFLLMIATGAILLGLSTLTTVFCSDSTRMLSARFHIVVQDEDHNGIVERYRLVDGDRTLLEVADLNQDSKLDEWIHYEDGKPSVILKDLNLDGRPDSWEVRKGKSGVLATDRDFDGIADEQSMVTVDEVY